MIAVTNIMDRFSTTQGETKGAILPFVPVAIFEHAWVLQKMYDNEGKHTEETRAFFDDNREMLAAAVEFFHTRALQDVILTGQTKRDLVGFRVANDRTVYWTFRDAIVVDGQN